MFQLAQTELNEVETALVNKLLSSNKRYSWDDLNNIWK